MEGVAEKRMICGPPAEPFFGPARLFGSAVTSLTGKGEARDCVVHGVKALVAPAEKMGGGKKGLDGAFQGPVEKMLSMLLLL